MIKLRKKAMFAAIPVGIVILIGIIIKKMTSECSSSAEHVRDITHDTSKEIESSSQELQEKIENRSAAYLKKNIDNIIVNAKSRLDQIGSTLKVKLDEYEKDNPSIQ